MQSALIIQTAFLGDVILATPVIEKLVAHFEEIEIDFLLKKGNESLLDGHPHLREVLMFDKKAKWSSFWALFSHIRKQKYDVVINLHRFFTSGVLASMSLSPMVIGFDKNPLSFFYHKKYAHRFEPDSMLHEVERNLTLLAEIADQKFLGPRLYPTHSDFKTVFRSKPYVCIAPTSKWYTKQWPENNWVELILKLESQVDILLIGSKEDREACDRIISKVNSSKIENTAGHLSLLEVAALMASANMNYVNDSAPLHIASAMNAPVTAVFCSTIAGFGFYPLSDNSMVVESNENLSCRPCGIHGRTRCPEGHFRCTNIDLKPLVKRTLETL